MRTIEYRHRPLAVRLAPQFLIVLGVLGCGLERPQAPTFHTEVHVPIGTLRYTVAELIDSEERIEGDTTGTHPVYFTYEGTIDSIEVGDRLVADVDTVALSATVSEFEMEIETPPPIVFPFGDFSPIEIPPGGIFAVVPPFSIRPVGTDLSPVEEFREGTVAVGTLQPTIHNELPITIENLVLQVEDRLLGETIATLGIPGRIDPGEALSRTIDLSGMRISNLLHVRILAGSSPGSGGRVYVQESDEVRIDVAFSEVRFEQLRAPIPPQSYTKARSTALEGSIRILRAGILSSLVPLRLESTIPLPATVEITLPQLQQDSRPWQRRYAMPAGSLEMPAVLSVDPSIEGYEVLFPNTQAPQMFRYQLRVEHDGSGGEAVDLSGDMGVNALMGPLRLELDELTGIVEPRELRIDPTGTEFSTPDETEAIEFLEATLALEITNEARIPGHMELAVAGTTSDRRACVHLEGQIAAATPLGPAITHLEWDQSNSDILDILNLRPDEIVFEGTVIAGDSASVVRVTRQDRIRGSYEIRSPIKVRVLETSYSTYPFDLEIDEDIQERIREEVLDAHAALTVRNHLPAGASLILQFAADSADVYSSPSVVLDSIYVPSGELDPATGRVVDASFSEVQLSLSSEDIDFFARDRSYGGVRIVPDTTGDGFVELLTTDAIEIDGIINFRLRVE